MRRSAVLLVVAALAASTGGTASAAVRKPLPRCAVFSDAKGDSALYGQAALGEQALDITAVRVETVGDAIVAKITVDKLSDSTPTKAWGDRFQFGFRVGNDTIDFYYKTSRTRDVERTGFYQQGLRVNNSFRTESGISSTRDLNTNTVTLSAKLSTIKAQLGRGIQGASINEMWADALGSYVGLNQTYDSATAPVKQATKVSACS